MRRLALLAALAFVLALSHAGREATGVLAQASEIVVTSASDAPETDAECPSEASCTLREAIETANAAEGDDEVRITFAPETFPVDEPATIEVVGSPLPEVTRDAVSIDGRDAGVIVDGTELDAEDEAIGLHLSGDGAVLRGLVVEGFSGTCVTVSGDDAVIGGDRETGAGNQLMECPVGLLIEGEGALVRGNLVGIGGDPETGPMSVGIDIQAANVTVGGEDLAEPLRNYIGNAEDGIRVGGLATSSSFEGTRIAGNVIGLDPEDRPAPVVRGITITTPSSGATVLGNAFAFASEAAISLPTAPESTQTSSNTIRENTFASLAGLEIDLGGDGIRNPNDLEDADTGPNGMLNHPVFRQHIQAIITGSTCALCTVELYRSSHQPGGDSDHATVPFATLTADSLGTFALAAPPVVPGDWITAAVTDLDGNTSEFAPTTRVGVGAIQCGNVRLSAGWNHSGYFGTSTVTLGATFPGDTNGVVRAVYELRPDGSYLYWFRDTSLGRTLNALRPGETYWFFLDAPLTMPEGFSVTSPLGAQLQAGWNDFVYFGASDNVHDAFRSIMDAGAEVYAWEPGPDGGQWHAWGTPQTPGFARDFVEAEACQAYMVRVDEPVILTPLQP